MGFLGASTDSVDYVNQDLDPLPPAIMSPLTAAVGGQEDEQQHRRLESLAQSDLGNELEGLPLTKHQGCNEAKDEGERPVCQLIERLGRLSPPPSRTS